MIEVRLAGVLKCKQHDLFTEIKRSHNVNTLSNLFHMFNEGFPTLLTRTNFSVSCVTKVPTYGSRASCRREKLLITAKSIQWRSNISFWVIYFFIVSKWAPLSDVLLYFK